MKSTKLDKLQALVKGHQLVLFVAAALVVTVTVTAVGLSVYSSNGTIKLDLSRPGYEKMRHDLQQQSDPPSSFASSGPLNNATLKQFNDQLDKSIKDLGAASNFGGASGLSDQSLGL
ncbi:MAG: hypothetical protein WAW91_01380 [Candidatus Nanoperiomorbaceae bacterium]